MAPCFKNLLRLEAGDLHLYPIPSASGLGYYAILLRDWNLVSRTGLGLLYYVNSRFLINAISASDAPPQFMAKLKATRKASAKDARAARKRAAAVSGTQTDVAPQVETG